MTVRLAGLGTEPLDLRGHADGLDFRQLQPALVTPVREVLYRARMACAWLRLGIVALVIRLTANGRLAECEQRPKLRCEFTRDPKVDNLTWCAVGLSR